VNASDATGPEIIWDPRYEWKAVLLLGLAFGLVGLDRWILAPLFPAMMVDLHLGYADLGGIVGVLALSWGVFAILFGRLSDRWGRRRVLIPALVIFSLLSGVTGLAGGLVMLLLARGAMGAAEGAFCPTSVAATAEASHPRRRGLNQGMQLSSFALMGFGVAPIIATQLLTIVPSWRYVFLIVGVPGLILAVILARVLRDPPHLARGAAALPPAPWSAAFKARNVQVATVALFCAMSCIFVMGAMVPNYLVDHLQLAPATMGLVMSAMGWGGFVGEFVIPGLSDRIGRRPAAILAFVGAAIAVWFFAHTPAAPLALFGWLIVVSFFGIGLLALFTGPIATEAVAASLTSSAIGIVSGMGEIFGGGIAPVIAGLVAERHGIANVFWVPLVGLSLGAIVSFALRETAPRRVGTVADA
jgi:predicted MFS family arabinose efflux permease